LLLVLALLFAVGLHTATCETLPEAVPAFSFYAYDRSTAVEYLKVGPDGVTVHPGGATVLLERLLPGRCLSLRFKPSFGVAKGRDGREWCQHVIVYFVLGRVVPWSVVESPERFFCAVGIPSSGSYDVVNPGTFAYCSSDLAGAVMNRGSVVALPGSWHHLEVCGRNVHGRLGARVFVDGAAVADLLLGGTNAVVVVGTDVSAPFHLEGVRVKGRPAGQGEADNG